MENNKIWRSPLYLDMFSLKPVDELEFGTLTTSQSHQIPSDLIADDALFESNLISFSAASTTTTTKSLRSPPRRRAAADQSRYGRKGLHREIERKRRQEMSTLCASLRNLLPKQQNKGKSSVCDQMEEAVDYIKQMHKKIEESRSRRDNMKKKLYNSHSSKENDEDFENGGDNCVVINKVVDGLEILIRSKSREVELSRLLAELVETQLDVVSCVSTRTKSGFLHKLEAQSEDMDNFDVSMLQERLISAMK